MPQALDFDPLYTVQCCTCTSARCGRRKEVYVCEKEKQFVDRAKVS